MERQHSLLMDVLALIFLIGVSGGLFATESFDCQGDGYFSMNQFLCITGGEPPDVRLEWNDTVPLPELDREIRTFCAQLPSVDYDSNDSLSSFGLSDFSSLYTAGNYAPLTLECYRDPAFDGGKDVPGEPASIQTANLTTSQAIPEPTSALFLTLGSLALLKRRRA